MVTNLKSKSSKFEYKLQREKYGENYVQSVEYLRVQLGLLVELHGQGESVEHDGHEDGVLAHGGGGEGPQLILYRVLRNITPHWLGIQGKFYAVTLKLVHKQNKIWRFLIYFEENHLIFI